jgi:hypothetical protein
MGPKKFHGAKKKKNQSQNFVVLEKFSQNPKPKKKKVQKKKSIKQTMPGQNFLAEFSKNQHSFISFSSSLKTRFAWIFLRKIIQSGYHS